MPDLAHNLHGLHAMRVRYGSRQRWLLLLLASRLGAGFVTWQQRMQQSLQPKANGAPSTLMGMRVLAHRSIAMGSLLAITYGAAWYGSTCLLPVLIQSGLGLSPSVVGSAHLPAGLVLAFHHAFWILVALTALTIIQASKLTTSAKTKD